MSQESDSKMEVCFSVIVSSFNNMSALVLSLPFWQAQIDKRFELIIADDGSDLAQREMFQISAAKTDLTVRHIWHEDHGFDKCGILNKAISVSRGDRLLFLDADMLPRFDLVANHYKLLKPNRFISGGSHINLNEAGQVHIAQKESSDLREVFESNILSKNGFIDVDRQGRIDKFGANALLFDTLTWRTNAFSGANASCWKDDAVAVNGFDEDWGYGGLDRDFGIRLSNNGVQSRRHQYSLVALHQEHPRPYKEAQQVRKNKLQLKNRMRNKVTWIEKGISSHKNSEVNVIWEHNT